jgi:hypothetical protein
MFLIGAKMDVLGAYPIGELSFGLGLLIAAPLNTHRILAVGWLVTLIGLVGSLVFGHIIAGDQILAAHVLAIGVSLLGIRQMARRGYVNGDALAPNLLIVGVGVVEYLQAAQLTPAHFLSFALSLWFPGFGLFLLGLLFLMTGRRTESRLLQEMDVSL